MKKQFTITVLYKTDKEESYKFECTEETLDEILEVFLSVYRGDGKGSVTLPTLDGKTLNIINVNETKAIKLNLGDFE